MRRSTGSRGCVASDTLQQVVPASAAVVPIEEFVASHGGVCIHLHALDSTASALRLPAVARDKVTAVCRSQRCLAGARPYMLNCRGYTGVARLASPV